MSLIEWKEQYSLGVPAVDYEHRELIDLINELYGNVTEPGNDTTVLDFLGELYTRVAAHFALEEKIMRDNDYDEYIVHKTDHERLLDDVRDLMDDYEDGVEVDVEAFGKRLDEWFSEHFRTRDARLHRKIG
jgi:hemerythrin